MLWALALLLASLPPGSHVSSISEDRVMSITTTTGSSVVITCVINIEGQYIHWYRVQEGKAPQHLLYHDSYRSTDTVTSGFSSEKYHASRDTKKGWNLRLRSVEESDSVGHGQLEQPEISVSRTIGQSAEIMCKVSLPDLSNVDIHWYRQKPNQHLEYLLYVRTTYNQRSLDGKNKKIEASKNSQTSISTLKVNFLKKEDEATYYCAFWLKHNIRASGRAYIKTMLHLCQPTSFWAWAATCCSAGGTS